MKHYIHFRYREATQNVTYHDQDDDVLDCGDTVNFTFYDDLIGIAQRFNHPVVPEPEVSSHLCSHQHKITNESILLGCISIPQEQTFEKFEEFQHRCVGEAIEKGKT